VAGGAAAAAAIGAAMAAGGAASALGGAGASVGGGDPVSGLLSFVSIAGQAQGVASKLPGFATGGFGRIGGAGGPDSKLFMARVTPGENFAFWPGGQPSAAPAAASGGPSHTIVNLNYDPQKIRGGRDIEDGVMRTLRKNQSVIRALLGL
jgi:hypothetical protein